MGVTTLDTGKACIRRVGMVMIRIDHNGIAIKGYRKRKWRTVPFKKLARLAVELDPPPRGLNDKEWADCLSVIGG